MKLLNLLLCFALVIIMLCGCGGEAVTPVANPVQDSLIPAAADSAGPWSLPFPVDSVQPWDQSADGRSAAALTADSEFLAGTQTHFESGNTTQVSGALRLDSGAIGSAGLAAAIYRLPLGAAEPGAVSADVNLRPMSDGTLSSFYICLADYAGHRWQFSGPYQDSTVIISAVQVARESARFSSGLGNLFIGIVAHDGSVVDVVGVGVNPADPADTTAPPAPAAPVVTPVAGGVLVDWVPVVAADTAGYKLYYRDSGFIDSKTLGVKRSASLQGRLFRLELADQDTSDWHLALAAVDFSGNESPVSEVVEARPLFAEPEPIGVWIDLDRTSALIGETVNMTATGAESYDWDLDGDGVFDVTGVAGGSQSVDTSQTGVIRPLVRGSSSSGESVILGSVSVIVSSNSRPVALATATPQSGPSPLIVDFSGSGTDFDGLIVGGGWDFEGDGTFDVWDDTDIVHVLSAQHTYTIPGLYNAKLQVIDDEGSWDVDTIAIQAIGDPPPPPNHAPIITAITANPGLIIPGGGVDFNVVATDSDGTIAGYAWDFDNDGTPDSVDQATSSNFASAGTYNVAVTVADDNGATATGHVTVSVVSDPTNLPPVITEFRATPGSGVAPADIDFEFNATDPDGTISEFALDFDNDGGFTFTSGLAGSQNNVYSTAGYYTCCLRATDNNGATTRSYLGVLVTDTPVNIPPVAIMTTNRFRVPIADNSSQQINLAAGSSYDPEGGDLTYHFDFFGNGNFSLNLSGNLGDNYETNGIYMPRLRVTDEQGATAYDTLLIEVYKMDSDTVHSSTGPGTIGWHTDTLDANGYALVAYVDASNSFINCISSTGPGTNSWANPDTIDNSGNTVRFPSLARVLSSNDYIGCSYSDLTTGDLMYAYNTSDNGRGGWSSTITADGANTVTGHNSLVKLSTNFPAIAYQTTAGLRFVRATSSFGTSWGTPVFADSTVTAGEYCSMAVVDGNPAIAYRETSADDLRYVRATSSDGSAWGAPLTVFATNDVGEWATLVVADGNPAIGFWDETEERVLFVRSTNETGTAWGAPVEVADNEGVMDGHVACAIVNGIPMMVWTSNQNLRMGVSNDPQGTGWIKLDADQGGASYDVGEFPSIADVNGFPVIAHYDNENDDLKVASARIY